MSKTNQIHQALKDLIKGEILKDELLSGHTSFKIGGEADYYVYPEDLEDLIDLVQFCEKENLPRFIIGNGSNLLVSDSGIRGMVIDLSRGFDQIQFKNNVVIAGMGSTLEAMLSFCTERGLSGYERLAGIPGQLGGCIKLNAGAFGGTISDRLKSVSYVDRYGTVSTLQREEIKMEYRFTDFPKDSILIEAEFTFAEGNPREMQAVQTGYIKRRKQKQPLSLPSAGSVFKRPPGDYAGRLIEEAGCKGLRIGDAMVSRKHANFIVNCHVASARDVMRVIDEIRDRVFKQFSIMLELEIHLIGFSEEGK